MSAGKNKAEFSRRGIMISSAGLIAASAAINSAKASQMAQPSGTPVGLHVEHIGKWDTEKLNNILFSDAPKFFGISTKLSPATNSVNLYRVTYNSVIPEKENTPIVASGLLAVPDLKSSNFPLLSYQHGTVYGKQQVPSFPDQSVETQLILAQFAGQGYVVIGADYFGMGISEQPEGYMVKGSHQQATQDMLRASREVLAGMNIEIGKLFLCGWSQGGFVTMAMLERLENEGEAATAVATASAPVDGFVALSGFLDFPRQIDADWATTLFILTAFALENYYGASGLARSLINDKYLDVSRKLYDRKELSPSDIPTKVHDLVRSDYFNPVYFRNSAYGRLIAEHAHAYRWIIQSPVRNYYGETDEAIPIGLGKLAMNYQHAIGAGNQKVEAISTGATSHRGTFMAAVPHWKAWFDRI